MKKKKSTKTKKIKLDKQDKTLLLTLGLLLILVIILSITALNLKNKQNNSKTNIVIPILEEQSQNEISVQLKDMSKNDTKEYIFKVTNYKDKDVNKKKVDYDITIIPSKNAEIKLYKNDSKKDLIDGKDYDIEENNLRKNKKQEDEYHMIIKAKNSTSKEDKITIKINS